MPNASECRGYWLGYPSQYFAVQVTLKVFPRISCSALRPVYVPAHQPRAFFHTYAHAAHTHTHRTARNPQVHILVPTFLTWFALTVVFCYRGDEVMEVVETATRMMLDVFHVSC